MRERRFSNKFFKLNWFKYKFQALSIIFISFPLTVLSVKIMTSSLLFFYFAIIELQFVENFPFIAKFTFKDIQLLVIRNFCCYQYYKNVYKSSTQSYKYIYFWFIASNRSNYYNIPYTYNSLENKQNYIIIIKL